MDGHDTSHSRRVEAGPSDPTTVWGRELDGVRAAGTPALVDERLYVPADAVTPESRSFNRLYSLGARAGETYWWAPLRIDLNGPPAVLGDRILVSGKRSLERGRVLCFGSRVGEEEWLYDVDARLTAPPTVEDGVAYVPDWSGEVHALWVADGSVLWSRRVEDTVDQGNTTFTTPAAVDGDTLYVGSNSGATGIVAMETDDGEVQWRAETNPVTGGPVVYDDLLLIQSYGLVVAYGTDGERRWGFNLVDSGHQPMAVDDEHVYAAGRETLYAITHDGERSWTYEQSEGRIGTPTVAGDSVLLRGEDRLTALSAATGEEQWSRTPEGLGEVVATPDALFVTGDAGRLLALGEE
ncbi:PQQ-binding-like beta-propeller repeat protein [Halolamina sp. CBA1230]|nr:PQQ-binding-like beta-propeller repeat protein [Halolamina sp. CBA1230]